jgi:prepilin-type N-terminal cleavage/methylation domain-containing protein
MQTKVSEYKKSNEYFYSFLTHGFTLIETLVSITVVAMLFGLGYANYRNYANKQALLDSARKVEGDLRLAQEYALSGKKPDSGCTVLDGYRFKVNTSSKSYSIHPVCDNGSEKTAVKNVSFGNKISQVSTTPTNNMLFKVIGEGTTIGTGGTQLTITLTQTGTNKKVDVITSSSGSVKIQLQ